MAGVGAAALLFWVWGAFFATGGDTQRRTRLYSSEVQEGEGSRDWFYGHLPRWCPDLVLPEQPFLLDVLKGDRTEAGWSVYQCVDRRGDGDELIEVGFSFPNEKTGNERAGILITAGELPERFWYFSLVLPLRGEPVGTVTAAGQTAQVIRSQDESESADFLLLETEDFTVVMYADRYRDLAAEEGRLCAEALLTTALQFLP